MIKVRPVLYFCLMFIIKFVIFGLFLTALWLVIEFAVKLAFILTTP